MKQENDKNPTYIFKNIILVVIQKFDQRVDKNGSGQIEIFGIVRCEMTKSWKMIAAFSVVLMAKKKSQQIARLSWNRGCVSG